MHRVEIHDQLSATLRREVDALIYHVWASESESNMDVTMLASQTDPAADPMDARSVHVLVRSVDTDCQNHHGNHQLIGYGRVAMAANPQDLRDGFAELGIAANDSVTEFPIAYISRLVVHPDVRGRGIATLIHMNRIDIARRLGASVVYGWAVGEKPRGALIRCGFRETSRRHGFKTSWYETCRDARLVRLDLGVRSSAALAI